MILRRFKRRVVRALSSMIVRMPGLRLELARKISSEYWPELAISIPARNFTIPVCYADSFASFREVFLEREYAFIQAGGGLPKRWIDLGCNNGFFSLYVAALHNQATQKSLECLLIDPDPKSGICVDRIKAVNPSLGGFRFIEGAIGPDKQYAEFVDAPAMQAHLARFEEEAPKKREVRVITADEILKYFPPPYDLVKVDIEGAEIDFLTNYGPILENASCLVVEWHSWNLNGVSQEGFFQQLKSRFNNVEIGKPVLSFQMEGELVQCAVYVCHR